MVTHRFQVHRRTGDGHGEAIAGPLLRQVVFFFLLYLTGEATIQPLAANKLQIHFLNVSVCARACMDACARVCVCAFREDCE